MTQHLIIDITLPAVTECCCACLVYAAIKWHRCTFFTVRIMQTSTRKNLFLYWNKSKRNALEWNITMWASSSCGTPHACQVSTLGVLWFLCNPMEKNSIIDTKSPTKLAEFNLWAPQLCWGILTTSPSQPQSVTVTTLRPVSNNTAWWQQYTCENKAVHKSVPSTAWSRLAFYVTDWMCWV